MHDLDINNDHIYNCKVVDRRRTEDNMSFASLIQIWNNRDQCLEIEQMMFDRWAVGLNGSMKLIRYMCEQMSFSFLLAFFRSTFLSLVLLLLPVPFAYLYFFVYWIMYTWQKQIATGLILISRLESMKDFWLSKWTICEDFFFVLGTISSNQC